VNPWVLGGCVVGALAALYGLHRVGLWLEREGWIRYVRNPPNRGAGTAAAFGELQRLFEPRTEHVYELKDEEKRPRAAGRGRRAAGPTDPSPT
jgi:hypothetical protein